jgi:hypothetical protein
MARKQFEMEMLEERIAPDALNLSGLLNDVTGSLGNVGASTSAGANVAASVAGNNVDVAAAANIAASAAGVNASAALGLGANLSV